MVMFDAVFSVAALQPVAVPQATGAVPLLIPPAAVSVPANTAFPPLLRVEPLDGVCEACDPPPVINAVLVREPEPTPFTGAEPPDGVPQVASSRKYLVLPAEPPGSGTSPFR